MEYFYFIILCFLICLSVSDLFVGISNDAVNFLSGALGSRIATFKTIMIVASLGVLIGATFSGGMMTIARTGVYSPEMFTFHELMLVMFSVVITEVLLLNAFNALGLPTSTTVSIVFALMGGGVSMAVLKILGMEDGSLSTLGEYINTNRAIVMIFGIISSVPVAFIGGTLIQYTVRLFFTFNYQRLYRRFGAIYGAFCMSAICYFLIFKGAKGSSLMTPEILAWMNEHTWTAMGGLFAAMLVIFQILIVACNFNIFRVVILGGTFALAFSFAGNDLVNFIGVPLAALDSWNIFQASGLDADTLMMEGLRAKAPTSTIYLLAAGLVMVITLWFSKKAMHVVRTTINLSASDRGDSEQFGSSLPGRLIVRTSIKAGELLNNCIPEGMRKTLDSRFEKPKLKRGEIALPFDAVRASVNLVFSAILIASATALTLPLSTTYVTFMVAMGSSFADGAWDRESAVYRVSGVLTVITGWFFTAGIAFTFCGLLVTLCYYLEIAAVIGLMCLTVYIFVRVNILDKSKTVEEMASEEVTRETIRRSVNSAVTLNFGRTIDLFEQALNNFFADSQMGLRRTKNAATDVYNDVLAARAKYYNFVQDQIDQDTTHFYYRVFTNMKEVAMSNETIIRMIHDHIANRHRIYKGQRQADLYELVNSLREIQKVVGENERSDKIDTDRLHECILRTLQKINAMQDSLMRHIADENLSLRSSELYLSILQAVREIINRYNIVFLMQRELNESCDRAAAEDCQVADGEKLNGPHKADTNRLDAIRNLFQNHRK